MRSSLRLFWTWSSLSCPVGVNVAAAPLLTANGIARKQLKTSGIIEVGARSSLAGFLAGAISGEILTFFLLEQHSVTEWQLANERNSREKTERARRAAEDLFKPAKPNAAAEQPAPAANGTAAIEPPPRRQPRIFVVPPRTAPSPAAETSGGRQSIRRKTAGDRKAAAVPHSQMGRVRALTSYGMTRAQVADLYGVSVDEIERIIRLQAHSAKSR